MNFLTMEYITAHSRFDDIREQTAEASLIELYAEAAEDTVLNYIDRTIEDLYEQYGKIPAPIIQAALLLVDNSYQHRSPSSMSNMYRVEYSFDALVKPYMNL